MTDDLMLECWSAGVLECWNRVRFKHDSQLNDFFNLSTLNQAEQSRVNSKLI